MSRQKELEGDLHEVKVNFGALLHELKTERFRNPDVLNKAKTKISIQLMRGILDMSYKDIIEKIVIPNHDPLTEKDLAKELKGKIYFPYTTDANEADFLKRPIVAKIRSVDPGIYELIKGLQPFDGKEIIRQICEYANDTKHDQSYQDKKNYLTLTLGAAEITEYESSVYVKDLPGFNIAGSRFPSITFNNCQGVVLNACVTGDIFLINCTDVEIIRTRHTTITAINSSFEINECGYPGVNDYNEKIRCNYGTMEVIGKQRGSFNNLVGRPLSPQALQRVTSTVFNIKNSDTAILTVIHEGIRMEEEHLFLLYELLEKHP